MGKEVRLYVPASNRAFSTQAIAAWPAKPQQPSEAAASVRIQLSPILVLLPSGRVGSYGQKEVTLNRKKASFWLTGLRDLSTQVQAGDGLKLGEELKLEVLALTGTNRMPWEGRCELVS